MAAPAGAPRRRQVHPGMHSPPTRAYRRMGECSRRVYAMAAHRLAQTAPPRSGAERAVVARGVHPGMRAAEGARVRARPGGAGTGASTDRHVHARHRPIPPFCVTTATASLWVRHRRTAQPSACLIPSQVSLTVGIATKSPLCIHTSRHFSAVFRAPLLDPPASPLRPHPFAVIGARRAPHAAVRSRRGADRYNFGRPSSAAGPTLPDPAPGQ